MNQFVKNGFIKWKNFKRFLQKRLYYKDKVSDSFIRFLQTKNHKKRFDSWISVKYKLWTITSIWKDWGLLKILKKL